VYFKPSSQAIIFSTGLFLLFAASVRDNFAFSSAYRRNVGVINASTLDNLFSFF
jgi:hypothetical protein